VYGQVEGKGPANRGEADSRSSGPYKAARRGEGGVVIKRGREGGVRGDSGRQGSRK